MTALVTVGIPTRDRVDLLREAIASVLGQTWQDFEIFVSDNSSTEETIDLLESFKDPRILYHRYERRIPMAANWRSSFTTPRTPYVALLQDDDYWGPHHLEHAMHCMESHPGAVSYSCAIQHLDGDQFAELQKVAGYEEIDRPAVLEPEEVFRIWMGRHSMQYSSVVFRRAALDDLDWGPANMLYPIDMQIITLAALKGPWIYDPRCDAFCRHHPRSVTNSAPGLRRKFSTQADHVMRVVAAEAIRLGCFDEEKLLADMAKWPLSQRGGIVVAFSAPYAPDVLRGFARRMVAAFPEILSSAQTSTNCRIAARVGRWYLTVADALNRVRAGWWPIGTLAPAD